MKLKFKKYQDHAMHHFHESRPEIRTNHAIMLIPGKSIKWLWKYIEVKNLFSPAPMVSF